MKEWRNEEQRIRAKQPFRAPPGARRGLDRREQKDSPSAWSICMSVPVFFCFCSLLMDESVFLFSPATNQRSPY